MMNMATVGVENWLAANEAACNRKRRVEQGDAQGHDRGCYAHRCHRLLTPDHPVAGKHEPYPEAASITKENRRGVEVEDQKSKKGTCEWCSGCYEANIAGEE